MSAWPRGSRTSNLRRSSAWRDAHSRFSTMVLPRGEGKPSTTRRSGPPAACASIVRISMGGTSPSCLGCERLDLLRHPLLIVRIGLHGNEPAHAVVAQAAELRAGDFVFERRILELRPHVVGSDGRDEPDRHLKPGDGVLLDAHFVEAKAVNDV